MCLEVFFIRKANESAWICKTCHATQIGWQSDGQRSKDIFLPQKCLAELWCLHPRLSISEAGQEREKEKDGQSFGWKWDTEWQRERGRLYHESGYCISFNAYWIFSNTLVMSVNPRREFVSRHRLLGCIIASKWGMSIHPSVQATFHLFSFVWDEDDDDWPSLPSQSLTPLGEKKAQKWVYSLGSMVGVGKQSFHLLSGFIANIKRIKELQRNLSHARGRK